jgi:hypothetical protein
MDTHRGLAPRPTGRKNPNVCQCCFDHLPTGGIEIDIGVVFADVRGSATPSEQTNPSASRPTPALRSLGMWGLELYWTSPHSVMPSTLRLASRHTQQQARL